MSDHEELKQSIQHIDQKVDRLLSWAEGDEKLGTPSIAQQIEDTRQEAKQARKIGYENREEINLVKKEVNMKSGKIGGGAGGVSGGAVAALFELLKSIFV